MTQFDPKSAFLSNYAGIYDTVEARENVRPPSGNHTCSVLAVRIREADFFLKGGEKLPGFGVSFQVRMATSGADVGEPLKWWLRDTVLPMDPSSVVDKTVRDRIESVSGILKGQFKAMLKDKFTGNLQADIKLLEGLIAVETDPVYVRVVVRDRQYKDSKTGEMKPTYDEYINAA